MKKLYKIVEELALSIVLVDPADLPELAKIHTLLEELVKAFQQDGSLTNSIKLSELCVESIAKAIIEPAESEKEIQKIKIAISYFQKVLNDKIDLVSFPEEFNKDELVEDNAKIWDDKILNDFLQKQEYVNEKIVELALSLENNFNKDNFSELLRIIHTIKGEAGVLALHSIQEVAHAVETVLQEKEESFNFGILLQVKDWLSEYIFSIKKNIKGPIVNNILNAINYQIKNENKNESQENDIEKVNSTEIDFGDDLSFVMDFVSESKEHLEASESTLLKCEAGSHTNENINIVFRSIHTIKGIAGFLNLEDICRITHETETLLDKVRKNQIGFSKELMDVCLKSIDKIKHLVLAVEHSAVAKKHYEPDKTISSLIEIIRNLYQRENLVSELSIKKVNTDEAKNIDTLHEKPKEKAVNFASQDDSIRINTEKLDKLINMVGELVIIQAMISEEAIKESSSYSHLRNIEHMRKITSELQEISMTLRMVPLKSTFLKMSRIVRDVSVKIGKNVELVLTGEDTELDKTVVDKIGDPLVHMVRNSVDHGIEEVSVRKLKGKAERGKIDLRAFHKGGNIHIEIEDDGKGIDCDVILKKAIERGLVSKNKEMTEKEIFNLLFEPGFSTAKVITDISGRGVGMDVVKKNIEALRGQVEIKSVKDKGSIFTIILPLTLAIIEGMCIKAGSERFILPLFSIIALIRPNLQNISTVTGKGEVFRFQGNLVPILRLSKVFDIKHAKINFEDAIFIIVENGDKKIALMADEILGQQEVVIKSLGSMLKGIEGISGGAILSDGAVGLILDIEGICDNVKTI